MSQKKKTIRNLKRCVKAGYWLVLGLCTFILFGALVGFIPLWSDVASFVFFPAFKLIILLLALLLAASITFFVRKKSAKRLVTMLISIGLILVFVFMCSYCVLRVNSQGEHISFWKALTFSVSSDVTEDDAKYTDQNEKSVGISVFYTDDGKQGKPVIFYTHGGGWVSGSRYDRLATTKALAENGYVVFSADYDLSDDEDHLYDFTEEQLLYALDWVQENANTYGADAEKLYLVGDSAGGNLALNLAYKINSGVYEGYSPVKAVSVVYPVTDIREFYDSENLLTSSSCKEMAVSYMGSIPSKEAGRYAEHNPKNYLSDTTPPTLIVQGTRDSTVQPKDTYYFAAKVEANGTPCRLIKLPFANHCGDFDACSFMGQAYINNTLAWFAAHQ